MATVTVSASTTEGRVTSTNATYSTARAGSGQTLWTGSVLSVGQLFSAGSYTCEEYFVAFDTSVLGASANILSATLQLKGSFSSDQSDTDFTVEARSFDWSPTVTTGDWVAGADLGSHTLRAHFDTSAGWTTNYNVFTDDALVAGINKTGVTYLILCSSRHRAGNTPVGLERVLFHSAAATGTSDDPRLVIEVADPITMPSATLQGVATMSATMHQNPQYMSGATFQGVASVAVQPIQFSDTPSDPDYTKFDSYIGQIGLQLYEGEGSRNQTTTLPLDLTRQDVGNNPSEMPSALGRQFAQNDFSHGSLQGFFHKQSSDPAAYLYSEGFDISESGILRHLNAVLAADGGALTGGSSGRMTQCQGKLFVADGTNVLVYDPITGTVTVEDPHAGQAAVTVNDLTTEGDQVYVALGASGIHVRNAAGTYSHYSDAQAILVAHVKDRLCAATARNFYEITVSGAAPAAKLALKEGWTFTDIGENGPYIYAPAIDEDSGLSKVHHFGLDGSLNVSVQGSTWLPNNELCYSFLGYLGLVFLGCGRVNKDGGKDALFYKAVPDEDGFLAFDLVAESEGAVARDLAIRALATQGRNVLLGWSLGLNSPYGEREGLARYDPALDAFSHHLASSIDTSTPEHTLSCGVFEGRVVFVNIDGVFYEDTDNKVATATLISSVANWNNAGLKNWDQSELTTKPMPDATAEVELFYSTLHPEEGEWSSAGVHAGLNDTKSTFDHANVESPEFTLKIVSAAASDQATAPEILGFSTRSNPTEETPTHQLIRTFDFYGKKAKSRRGSAYYESPRGGRDMVRSLYLDWFRYHESDASYLVRLTGIQEIKRVSTYQQTRGSEDKERYVVIVEMEGQEVD